MSLLIINLLNKVSLVTISQDMTTFVDYTLVLRMLTSRSPITRPDFP